MRYAHTHLSQALTHRDALILQNELIMLIKTTNIHQMSQNEQDLTQNYHGNSLTQGTASRAHCDLRPNKTFGTEIRVRYKNKQSCDATGQGIQTGWTVISLSSILYI